MLLTWMSLSKWSELAGWRTHQNTIRWHRKSWNFLTEIRKSVRCSKEGLFLFRSPIPDKHTAVRAVSWTEQSVKHPTKGNYVSLYLWKKKNFVVLLIGKKCYASKHCFLMKWVSEHISPGDLNVACFTSFHFCSVSVHIFQCAHIYIFWNAITKPPASPIQVMEFPGSNSLWLLIFLALRSKAQKWHLIFNIMGKRNCVVFFFFLCVFFSDQGDSHTLTQ